MPKTFNDIQTQAHGFMESRILLTAVELDLFSTLGKKSMPVERIASKLKTSLRGTDILLHALTGLGYLKKNNTQFSNSPISSKYLDAGSPEYRGGILRHHLHLWDSWTKLTEVVKTGNPAYIETNRKKDIVAGQDFIWGMFHTGWENAKNIAQMVDLTGVSQMLDLGGGPGSYAIAFAQQNPKLYAVVFDLPYALEITKDVVAKYKMERRIRLQSGDIMTDDIGTGYDLVLISQVMHSFSGKQNQLMIKKAFQALVPGGRLIIHEFFVDSTRTKPGSAAVFAVNMLVNTEHGRTYSRQEVSEWLERAGFTRITFIPVNERSGLLIANKSKIPIK